MFYKHYLLYVSHSELYVYIVGEMLVEYLGSCYKIDINLMGISTNLHFSDRMVVKPCEFF